MKKLPCCLICVFSLCVLSLPAFAAEKKTTPQGEKMKSCNAEAKAQALKGEARKAFMSSCLKKKPPG